jgi:hypothetical protein
MAMPRDEIREHHDLRVLEADLIHRFAAALGRAEVDRELRDAYHRFDGAPIRGFVLILTEQAVVARLTARARTVAVADHRLRVAGA